jgi:hypothetical protein
VVDIEKCRARFRDALPDFTFEKLAPPVLLNPFRTYQNSVNQFGSVKIQSFAGI